mmetsp:Transcript_18298/g.28020  ORF Transcript_18298/g.28020 Transcript_18298/m.28020 type:complete len:127 (-) Transcript_18298:64-444(-)
MPAPLLSFAQQILADLASLKTTSYASNAAAAEDDAARIARTAAHAAAEERHDAAVRSRYVPALPVCETKFEIVKAVRRQDVTIVCGKTGSGKSTQVPQFLYEAELCRPRFPPGRQPSLKCRDGRFM